MKHVLIFGAGRSSLYLIEYLASYCVANDLQLTVCDRETEYAMSNVKDTSHVEFVPLDIFDTAKVSFLIQDSTLVVSLLPADLHIHIARLCLSYKKNLATASYISEEMKELDAEVKGSNLVFLNEMGLDPGIDHLSAMKMMDQIRSESGEIISFESYCGGLVADEDDGDNPWKYKFSWNPRNVVLAGQGPPAQYLDEGKLKLVPYHHLFRYAEKFEIEGYGTLEGYPNRDSLKYMSAYGLDHVTKMIRGTLRKPGYCSAWQALVSAGLTDNTTILEFEEGTSLKDWVNSFLPKSSLPLRENISRYTQCGEKDVARLEWLGLFSNEPLPLFRGTSAQILEELLKKKWQLEATDHDLVVMLHRIKYVRGGSTFKYMATMVRKGESNTHTAMAMTVGLPLAIGCRLILEDKVKVRGVVAPVTKDIYEPVMQELETFGIRFIEKISAI